jgi:hypothetical protein
VGLEEVEHRSAAVCAEGSTTTGRYSWLSGRLPRGQNPRPHASVERFQGHSEKREWQAVPVHCCRDAGCS